MPLVESYFTTLTKKGVVDATRSAEAILQLRVESKERVDELVDKALAGSRSEALFDLLPQPRG